MEISRGDIITTRDGLRIRVTDVSAGGAFFWGYYAEDETLHWQRRRTVWEMAAYNIATVEH